MFARVRNSSSASPRVFSLVLATQALLGHLPHLTCPPFTLPVSCVPSAALRISLLAFVALESHVLTVEPQSGLRHEPSLPVCFCTQPSVLLLLGKKVGFVRGELCRVKYCSLVVLACLHVTGATAA